MGDWSETDYLREKARIEAELAQLRPVETVHIEQAVDLLQTLGTVLDQSTDDEQKQFFQAVLDEVLVRNKKVVAVRPKPNYYNLLRMSRADPTGFGFRLGSREYQSRANPAKSKSWNQPRPQLKWIGVFLHIHRRRRQVAHV